MIDWNKIKYFKSKEFSYWEKVDPRLIQFMDDLRAFCERPIVIHSAYATKGHSKTSKHYIGKAVDFHIKDMEPLDALLHIETKLLSSGLTDKSGLGIYLDWRNIGFHLDLHAVNRKRRWGQIPFEGKNRMVGMDNAIAYYKYLAMNKHIVYNYKRRTYKTEERKYVE